MKLKGKKTLFLTILMLVVIVALPLAGFLLISNVNKNKLPFYGPQGHTIPDFSFINQQGELVSDETFKGKIVVADFFFTYCPSICKTMTSQMKRVQDEFLSTNEVRLLSFTVDPERDTPDVLAAYAERYGADNNMWTFFTGDKKELYLLARNGFFITALEGKGDELDFIHSEKLALVDKDGSIRGYYDGTDSVSVNKLINDVNILLAAK